MVSGRPDIRSGDVVHVGQITDFTLGETRYETKIIASRTNRLPKDTSHKLKKENLIFMTGESPTIQRT